MWGITTLPLWRWWENISTLFIATIIVKLITLRITVISSAFIFIRQSNTTKLIQQTFISASFHSHDSSFPGNEKGKTNNPQALEKLEKRSPTHSTAVSEASCLSALFFSPPHGQYFQWYFSLSFSAWYFLSSVHCSVQLLLGVWMFGCRIWRSETSTLPSAKGGRQWQNTEPAKIFHGHGPQIQMAGNDSGEELSPGSCSGPPLHSLCRLASGLFWPVCPSALVLRHCWPESHKPCPKVML